MTQYWTKRGLYNKVDELRQHYGIYSLDYPIDIKLFIKNNIKIKIGEIPFKTNGLRGMAVVAEESNQWHTILLNSNRDPEEQNFDCSHEFIHICFQGREYGKTFNCFERVLPSQNSYEEWQANEGGAELLVPYRLFIPRVAREINDIRSWEDIVFFKNELAKEYNVSAAVIKNRLESLKYEINQYLNGVPVEHIEILSKSEQDRRHIEVTSLNDISNRYYSEALNRWNNEWAII
jgi:Zn-dependent peptidase ImmA (M78 family)